VYGDTTIIRGLASALRERADDIRDEAARLAGRTDAVPWHGLAATAMRGHAHSRVRTLRRTAELHDEAADTLDRHAREVDRLKELIAAIERRVHALIDAAKDRLSSLIPDPVDELIDRFVPPPPGSRDWLTVDLPGLG
jgi:hypothetical protein